MYKFKCTNNTNNVEQFHSLKVQKLTIQISATIISISCNHTIKTNSIYQQNQFNTKLHSCQQTTLQYYKFIVVITLPCPMSYFGSQNIIHLCRGSNIVFNSYVFSLPFIYTLLPQNILISFIILIFNMAINTAHLAFNMILLPIIQIHSYLIMAYYTHIAYYTHK